jgi:hypothetical protein
MAPNVLNDGDSGVFGCAEAPFGDVALPHTRCPGRTEGALSVGHLFDKRLGAGPVHSTVRIAVAFLGGSRSTVRTQTVTWRSTCVGRSEVLCEFGARQYGKVCIVEQ